MSVTFWVTSDCNLNCKYCYEGSDKHKKYMSRNIVDKSIDQIFSYSKYIDKDSFMVLLHGGEPFLAFDIIKYIVARLKKECMDRGIKISFATTTNATILNDEMINFIIQEIPNITVSLDGTKETHDKMRPFKNGNGSHKIALENSLKLLKHLPNIRLRTTFDSTSIGSLYQDIKFLIDNGFKYIVPAPNLFDKDWSKKGLDILEEQMRLLKKYIKDKKDVSVSILDRDLFSLKGSCTGGKSTFNIYPNGELYPCTMAAGNKEFCIGNIYDGIDINKRDKLLSYSEKTNLECEGCTLYNFCIGPRCKIINKLLTNDYLSASPVHCAIENLQYKVNILEM
ncbi:radical SAM additional 4Fe4S-binding SPASM domain protein [Clostridium argentinense CDC 2741]|uniref:Radical SAM additional 4Fe4S-binding SPASM domain protein n=2 Tax=Clostridium argentinense TaxID=29341 RepID=A0A0C1R2W0_9CLOT|nr:radical SAM/SPASM domain-containing protein [Clostridium argentinense]ARC83167.1 radical SAM/SPASM domain-containing protein [Clostridium argentinense]KIE44781.1 radical SAM additional 4Fe4S-binding SPASM domain protein [Clostridium argentinense CDC 2741]NFF41411.1 radical SAM/SPASM domain-containing protein [Clostridium argentinense]NFP52075.1 radical SAM/SPASM domain-containing protein [Clostridium argentinense]NFP74429.1 radical SAM/SPASM domain-containing protein [Clostridium argentinen